MTFDDGSWSEQLAGVACVLVYDTRRDRFTTLKARAGIEIRALATCMQFSSTVWTGAFSTDGGGSFRAARRALHSLAERHHFWRPWSFTFDGL